MKRDLSLVRKILLAVEALDEEYAHMASSLAIEGCDGRQISYHVGIMADARLLRVTECSDNTGTDYLIGRLSWAGHEFLDAARDESRWKKLVHVGSGLVQAAGLEAAKRFLQQEAASLLEAGKAAFS